MRTWWTLTRRELAGYFLSLAGYIIIAAAVFMMGYSFVVLLVNLQQEATPMPVTEVFYNTQFFWLILLLTTPVITMRLFAQEKFSGTFETLMTTPVSDLQVVLAKFAAAMAFFVVMWLPLLPCLLIVRHYTHDAGAIDPGTIGSTYLGILLLGGLLVSLGCCASALTRSQGIAAMISLVFGASVFMLAYIADQLPAPETWQGQVLVCFALFDQMHDFVRGVVDTRPVVLLGSLTLFFLFLTLRIVESRRWK
jgi:ABC-2 type transport system permease protein